MKEFKESLKEDLLYFLVIGVCIFISNLIINFKSGNEISPFDCIPALILLAAIGIVSVIMKGLIKVNIPSIIYACLLATILSLPVFPWYNAVIQMLGGLQFNAILTPILAFSGISIGKDLAGFIKAGPKLLVVSIFVFAGAYIGTAIIAQIGLMITGQI